MLTFKELKKNCSKEWKGEFLQQKVAIMGDCATQLLAKAVEGYGYEYGLKLEILDTDYNQIIPQLMDPSSETYRFSPDYILLVMCTEKVYEAYCQSSGEDRSQFAEQYFQRIQQYWEMATRNIPCRIIQFNFAELNDMVFGSFANKVKQSFVYQLRKLNLLLMEGVEKHKNVFLVDLSSIQNTVGRDRFFDEKYYYSSKIPFSLEVLPMIAKRTVDVLSALQGKGKKCVVLDLDNTLWGGVIGDDGMGGIQIGELGAGHAFSEFQHWLKQLKERGIILTVCSKNNESTAKEPFEKHPDMVLRLEDISMFVANWDDKASNIKYIQQTLNLGMDSFVFLDDNPFERNMVRSLVEGITVPELPEDPARYLTYLRDLNLFEASSYSEEDANRTKQYQQEIGRQSLQKQFESIDDYLVSLEMFATAKPFDAFHYPRISQLTQRSNQFNLRTVRYTEGEIAEIADSDGYLTIYFTLRDKFGDHGLISVVILEKQSQDTLFIDTWLMSCRVLKRGMEEFIVNHIIQAAKEHGFTRVIGEYRKTAKNSMVENIYRQMGFAPMGEGRYQAEVSSFTPNKTWIQEEV